ncbi:MAG TPA: HXXEE domain-containing protein [Terriglobales bacterium]|nr:HXXEE domain-containing protein [Terriglobales bacterium]
MNTRLLGIIVVIEAAVVTGIVQLSHLTVFPSKTAVVLIWLLPIAFGLHVAEEFALPGGFGEWYRGYRPQWALRITPSYLLRVNVVGGAACLLMPLGAFDYRGGYSFGGIHVWCILTSAMAFNGMLHLLGTIQTRQYSPGVVTGMAVYVPLLAVSVAYFVGTRAMILPTAILCVVLGCVLQPVLNYRHERALSREQHS